MPGEWSARFYNVVGVAQAGTNADHDLLIHADVYGAHGRPIEGVGGDRRLHEFVRAGENGSGTVVRCSYGGSHPDKFVFSFVSRQMPEHHGHLYQAGCRRRFPLKGLHNLLIITRFVSFSFTLFHCSQCRSIYGWDVPCHAKSLFHSQSAP